MVSIAKPGGGADGSNDVGKLIFPGWLAIDQPVNQLVIFGVQQLLKPLPTGGVQRVIAIRLRFDESGQQAIKLGGATPTPPA